MKNLIAAVVIVAMLLVARGTSAAEDPAVATDLKKLEEGWMKAAGKKDADPLNALLHADYTITTADGLVLNRDALIDNIKSGTFVVDSGEFDDAKANVYGDTAVFTGKLIFKAKWEDMDLSGDYRGTYVYVKKDGKWQCVAAHVSRIRQ